MTTATYETDTMNDNLEMNDDTYELRSRVMSFIYEAKEVVDLPRIDVRITEPTEDVRGAGRMGENIIWVGADVARNMSDKNLRTTVYHELCHAVGAVGHQKGCPLMGTSSQPISKRIADDLLTRYIGEVK